MIEIASQIVLCLVIAAFIGFFIGIIIGKSFSSGSTLNYSTTTAHGGAAAGNIYNKPLIRSAPRPVGKDNLKKIITLLNKKYNFCNWLQNGKLYSLR